MLPTVTPLPPVQPHHHLHHDAPYDHWHRRSRLQWPHPVQRFERLSLVAEGGRSRSQSSGEHALRRKTPNGTLAAGYDGTPGETAVQPPATKHILVSSLDYTQQQQPPLADQLLPRNFPPLFNPDPASVHANSPSWVRSLNSQQQHPTGIDSMLYQTLPIQQQQQQQQQHHHHQQQQQQRYIFPHGAAYIPTVLPATLQPCGGPTAPAGSTPYGPYWPDGAFIPYRPAALRDAFAYGQQQQQQQHEQAFGPQPLMPIDVNKTNFPPRHAAHKSLDLSHHPHILPGHHAYTSSSGAGAGAAATTTAALPTTTGYHFPGTRQVEFKEKILSWAHGVYVDLLASIHQARRHSAASAIDGQSSLPRFLKPSIFPKPPRQPGLDFATAVAHPTPPIDIPRHNSYPSSQYDLRSLGGALPSSGRQHTPLVNSNNINSPKNNNTSHHHHNHHRHTNYLHHHHHSQQLPRASVGRHGLPARIGGTSISTTANAISALEMLSHLCSESGWEWIDGMLLGGCLAYGLGDYPKAMRWYSRIIARDATHVEAISNLAATLLALDRREEAMQHWFRAVKLRPSFFEAVEHLIGLLCSSQRGKEAVQLIHHVQSSLRLSHNGDCFTTDEHASETESDVESRVSSTSDLDSYDKAAFDYDDGWAVPYDATEQPPVGFGSSGYAVPGADNGRMLALIHAKGNMLYALGDHVGAAAAFEDAILIAAGRRRHGIRSLIHQIFIAVAQGTALRRPDDTAAAATAPLDQRSTILLYPDKALQTAKLVFSASGGTPLGLQYVAEGLARKAAVSTTSNSLLSLAKIYQDGMSTMATAAAAGAATPNSSCSPRAAAAAPTVREILALYYLSLSLQPSPSTANNVGILLASIQHNAAVKGPGSRPPGSGLAAGGNGNKPHPDIPGVVPGSGVSLALAYYNYGLHLDARHAHLYTNLGSLLKDIGQLQAAIKMYEQAVHCDGQFDIALANLANAVKDAGRINDAITYYQRAVKVNPEFAEAVCGLANALNSVCKWVGRGGVARGQGFCDRWHVDEQGMLHDASSSESSNGWIQRVVDIVNRQLREGESWGRGILTPALIESLGAQIAPALDRSRLPARQRGTLVNLLQSWAGQRWEGARIVRLVERATRALTWQWYQDRYVYGHEYAAATYPRPQLPAGLTPPNAPTVLPFHTFTCPLSAKQIRQISQRNGLRISCATLRAPWLPSTVYRPPPPPNPYLRVGYVSSDFNNHPLAHLMQSVFGLHDPGRVKAYCYATTASDKSVHRNQIETEAPVFHDASSWPVDRLVEQIVDDGIHILVNLNGYTRGARNEVFAARPAPIHMSFMGFAGTLGAEWCDYILADELSIPRTTLGPATSSGSKVDRSALLEDRILEADHGEDQEDWVYGEKIVFTRDTFFCCDHRQSAPDAQDLRLGWEQEQQRRWRMRKELFPNLSDDTIILGNFNQLYKIEPTTFRTWLRILARIPNAVLWLLRFPEVGEQNLRETAIAWAGEETAARVIFTDVAPKNAHIARAKVLDLFLDTPECNAHTTATDVLWSGTPLLTYPRYEYKMCSRMASSILSSALPRGEAGRRAAQELIACSDEDYEAKAIQLCTSPARLGELRRLLFLERRGSRLFDTRRWVGDLEEAYERVWKRWVKGEEGDIWL
ncbi:hypothetical protein ASPZODRAFT_151310 [Penicilliopsis zonata CBS 506.65]|uniref:protein O-GlcNAc transferase n=1 Tax=Penicilliopsis zonata CBS 506.65 TaxID=1073090 RepID=A0A1L9SL22_9EURO|nr:hypothetical protein ASPZODRAFT_151310 [Penicilliopsis zonata CBS 506.65]OJJ47878.1 hypothetical protein ASPZODRAFT_151310 [Penicilliopsis zonata CBS 506.65]